MYNSGYATALTYHPSYKLPHIASLVYTYQMNETLLSSVERLNTLESTKIINYHGMIILTIFATKQIDYSVF